MGKKSREGILKAAIEMAIKNGYRSDKFSIMVGNTPESIAGDLVQCHLRIDETIIFSHDFAKTFWKGAKCECGGRDDCFLEGWQYHLQQMVLEEDPILYLERFLS